MQTGFDLPQPSADGLAHSRRVAELISNRIAVAGGWLSFADFMELALYEPGLGYYTAGARKFGEAGDFVTAPELGSLFARALARVCRTVLAEMGGGAIIEFGGGSGALAADLLLAMQESPPDRYLMVEVSADLRERQQRAIAERVPRLLDRVQWLDELPGLPIDGVLIANELLDALPIERFSIRDGRLRRLGVTTARSGFAWATADPPDELSAAVSRIERDVGWRLPDGYTSEVSLRQPPWIGSMAGLLQRGLAVFVDYGCTRREYYHPERSAGTLACHYRHRSHDDPFLYPGLQDITAWVDFSAVAAAASAAGFEVAAYATQAHFLLGAGLLAELSDDGRQGMAPGMAAHEARRLLMPGEMGERFKALLLTRGGYAAPPGLVMRDLRHSL